MNNTEQRSGRELRLVVLVVVVSVAVLLVAARFRFPVDRAAAPPSPLEQLAVRATYDELAGAITTLLHRVTPSIEMVRVEAGLVPAIRMRPGFLLAHVPAGMQVTAVAGQSVPAGMVVVDPKREIAVIREAAVSGSTGALPIALDGFGGFAYVAAVEAAPGGPTARPIFVGRVDASGDGRWNTPPLVLGGTRMMTAGTLVFAMDGRFVGLVHAHGVELTLVPFATLDAAVSQLTKTGGGRP